MILSRPGVDEPGDYSQPTDTQSSWTVGAWDRAPLRWQLSLVTAAMVAVAVGVMTIVAYWTLSSSLTRGVDAELETKASSVLARTSDPAFQADPASEIQLFKNFHPDTDIAYFPPNSVKGVGDEIPLVVEGEVLRGDSRLSIRNEGERRVIAMNNEQGAAVIISQNMDKTFTQITSLGIVLLVISALGVLMAIATGMVVATTGLRPVSRLQQAVDYVARTDELQRIEVVGNDELAQLTRSFNEMLESLEASRRKQTDLVADAGHELKTPLTSLRTNIELLMMVSKSNNMSISASDREDLERDVIAQIEELSTLIGDLVDLAREDNAAPEAEFVDLVNVADTALERVQRRRPDVEFKVQTVPWFMYGDSHSLNRAILNLLDNAAKWSPAQGVVRVSMKQLGSNRIELSIADSGPGIPAEDREKIFERFYRSVSSRSMPGSGLGLAITKQTVERHSGTIRVDASDDGGTLMRMVLPGSPDPQAIHDRLDELVG